MSGSGRGTPDGPVGGGLARWWVEHPGAGWAALLATLACGFLALLQLPRQEDPALPGRIARIVCIWPGASASEVEQQVTRSLEQRTMEMASMLEVSSETRNNVAIITLGQRPAGLGRIEQEWDVLRGRLAEVPLPEGCRPPVLQTDFGDVVTLLLAVSSGTANDYRPVVEGVRRLVEILETVSEVGRVRTVGEVPETLELTGSPAKLQQHGIPLSRLIEVIGRQGHFMPGSLIPGTETNLPVRVAPGLGSERELRDLVLGRGADGQPLRVEALLDVRRGDVTPLPFHVDVMRRSGDDRLTRERSILLAVEMKSGRTISRFDREVRAAVDGVVPTLPAGVGVHTLSDQPASVKSRLSHFNRCFLEAVAVIMVVALLLMEWRAAVIVACAIPLTVAMTLTGMWALGIPLHQISITALIIALGMLVDDPVVAADGINRELAAGTPRRVAAWLGPWKLRRAIFFATLINIFAFLPLLLLPGDKKSFIYALPVVVTLSLVCSRIVSMTFVPLLGRWLLRGQGGLHHDGAGRGFSLRGMDRLRAALLGSYRAVLAAGLRHPWKVLIVVHAVLVASLLLAPGLGRQFFPPAERNQMLVDITLPESSSLERTRAVCDRVFTLLQPHDEIVGGAIFMGGSGPRFYYNITPKPPADHRATILINTRQVGDVPTLMVKIRAALDREVTDARCVVRQLEQGPPVEAPVQIRLTGDDPAVLRRLADAVSTIVKNAGGYKVDDTLGVPVDSLRIKVDQSRASALGVGAESLVGAVQAVGAGLRVTEVRESGRAVPVVFKLRVGPEAAGGPEAAEMLRRLPVQVADGAPVPLAELAEVSLEPGYAVFHRHGGRRSVVVESYAPFGDLPAAVVARARSAVEQLVLPAGYKVAIEGEDKELAASRREMGGVMIVSLALIAAAMVVQFQSFSRSAVVMLTVPLGLIGALGGLALTGSPVGFMAMLACASLAGIVVSHIIVLCEAIEEARAETTCLHEALISASLSRMRPVLVTTLATAGGLLPLALTGGALWKPLTAVHIFGLLAGTVLTLFVLPVWYVVVVARRHAPPQAMP